MVQIDHASPWSIGELTRADATARRVGPQVGSNPDGLFRGADGRARYVKFYDDAGQSYGEVVANRAYRELGIDAPVSALVRDEGDAIVGVANELIDHRGILGKGRLAKGHAMKVLRGFAADVWLSNWDAVGLALDNIVKTHRARDSVARIDQGGSLLVRARGKRKPPGGLETISEWYGFADAARNPAYAKVFRAAGYKSADGLREQALSQIEAIEKLGKRTDNFKLLAPPIRGVSEADQAAIRALLARRSGLLQSQIAPRIRAVIAPSETLSSDQLNTKRRMGEAYGEYLDKVRRNLARGSESYGMTDPELASLYVFTANDKKWGYLALNNSLRGAHRPGGRPVSAKYDALRATLLDALAKMPDHPAKGLKRGATLTQEEMAVYEPGEIVTEPAFTSTSLGKGLGGNVKFTYSARWGQHHPSAGPTPRLRDP